MPFLLPARLKWHELQTLNTMTDAAKFDIDSAPAEASVQRTLKSLDTLVRGVEQTDRTLRAISLSSQTNLEKLKQGLTASTGVFANLLNDSLDGQIRAIKSGVLTQIDVVKKGNNILQAIYEQRLASQVRLSDEELRLWKAHAVKLGGIQDAQLKGMSLSQIASIANGATSKLKTALQNQLTTLQEGFTNLGYVSSTKGVRLSEDIVKNLELSSPLKNLAQRNKAALQLQVTELAEAMRSIGTSLPTTSTLLHADNELQAQLTTQANKRIYRELSLIHI